MLKEFITYGHVDKPGKLSIYNRAYFDKKIRDYFSQTSIEIVFREKLYQFSDSQRGYYFGIIVKEIQKAWLSTGIIKSLSEIDYELRNKYLYYEILNAETGLFEKTVHTLKKDDTEVSDRMMREYCELCIIWASQNLDWNVPYPNEAFGDSDMTDKQNKFENGVTEKSTF